MQAKELQEPIRQYVIKPRYWIAGKQTRPCGLRLMGRQAAARGLTIHRVWHCTARHRLATHQTQRGVLGI